jgi:hypothetical protein
MHPPTPINKHLNMTQQLKKGGGGRGIGKFCVVVIYYLPPKKTKIEIRLAGLVMGAE